MKGMLEALPSYLYIIIGLVVGLLLLSIIYKATRIFFVSDNVISGDKLKVANSLAKISEKCWSDHRRGLDSKSDVCRNLKYKPSENVTEKDMTKFLDCSLLPNFNCYPNDCRFCQSKYFEDNDKVYWFIENESSEITVSYLGDKRAIRLSGEPCDKICLCKRKCKEYCIEIDKNCEKICFYNQTLCEDCKVNMKDICSDCFEMCNSSSGDITTTIPTGTTTIPPNPTTTITGVTTTSVSTSTVPIASTTISVMCTPENIANLVDPDIMIDNLQYLTQSPRPVSSNWNRDTADYIANKLTSYGLENVHFEDFVRFGINGRNVVGELGPDGTPIIVVGGHRDSVSSSVGAIDNGGGSVNVMEIARALVPCKDRLKNKIVFVLFDAEELGVQGSIAYMNDHSGDNIIRMMNFDCEGYRANTELLGWRTATDLATSANNCCNLLGISCDINGPFNIPGAASDFAPFDARGIRYLYPASGCNYFHTTNDNMNEVGGAQLGWSARIGACVIADQYIV